ncbi:hypothetical protein [Natronomonas sp. EA1]
MHETKSRRQPSEPRDIVVELDTGLLLLDTMNVRAWICSDIAVDVEP